MKKCVYLDGCKFFSMINNMDEDVAEFYMKTYCYAGTAECARKKVRESVGKEFVPEGLYPNELRCAEGIIREVMGE